jgi:hypothetical protein
MERWCDVTVNAGERPMLRLRAPLVVASLMVVLGAAVPPATHASPQVSPPRGRDAGSWSVVRALPPGTSVRVVADDGSVVTGMVMTSTDDSVDVQPSGDRRHLPRASVARVERERQHVARHVGRGFLVGAAAGAVLGVAATRSNRGKWGLALGLGWGGIGAAAGAVRGALTIDREIVYERPVPRP